ncbi:hypothetical protein PHABIO_80 [Pseudomonas phage Phabio]|uniref:Uncharacterized protein n=1 Tax=Pseudomonas phage Phabio TaxID=2006668 RepID=A0A1Y0STA7_9CAUD|nr:hypothetical protein MZD05_gp080 [Pseudomonas phage Phabio]ARV76711.1 hypothetical protein PHABIO_80 [Pseudomonas phage Phabio]
MKLINVPLQCLVNDIGYVIGADGSHGTITGFTTDPDGRHFQQNIHIEWVDGRKATYLYPEEVGSLKVDTKYHESNLTSWIKHHVNRMNRHIKFLKKSIVSLNEDDRYE